MSQQGQAVARWEPTQIREVDLAVAYWLRAPLLPYHYRDRDGKARVGDVVIACLLLDALGVSPRAALAETFVIKGRVGFKGTLLAALAARVGWDLEPVSESPESSTWRIRRLDDCPPKVCPHWYPPKTITMAEAKQAGWTKRSTSNPEQPSQYELIPDRMLSWRCITWLIDHHAPGVRFGIEPSPVARQRGATLDWDTGPESAPSVGEVDDGPVPAEIAPGPAEPPATSAPGRERVPVEVIDNSPEARGMEPSDERDPGRPF
jgi:hypothetical protein